MKENGNSRYNTMNLVSAYCIAALHRATQDMVSTLVRSAVAIAWTSTGLCCDWTWDWVVRKSVG